MTDLDAWLAALHDLLERRPDLAGIGLSHLAHHIHA